MKKSIKEKEARSENDLFNESDKKNDVELRGAVIKMEMLKEKLIKKKYKEYHEKRKGILSNIPKLDEQAFIYQDHR